ncbi:MAG TPA: hypothetical protein VJS44_15530 [Pyrinomonadaceae bacterium]|nr:hypothetical protein [Pyrinomonadaceae bacterium]
MRLTHGLATRKLCLAAALVAVSLATTTVGGRASGVDKMTVEEVVAKHLASIGADETRQSIKNRIVVGAVTAVSRNPAPARIQGRTVMASEGQKNMLAMVFDSTNYPKDNIAFDGSKVTVSFLKAGQRSFLGNFMLGHEVIVKQGLVGGVLTSGWPLLHGDLRGSKLQYIGTKKLDGRDVHQLSYLPRGGSDLEISIYFDAESFRHVRTEYERVASAQMGSRPELSAQQKESRYKMVEEFSDFKKEGGLTLPHAYTIKIIVTNPNGNLENEWAFTFNNFMFNQRLDPGSFDVAAS